MNQEADKKQKKTVDIIVNRQTVVIEDKKVTGREIKEAAIAQGVRIELDFQLAVILEKGRQIIGDADEVVLTNKKSTFVATAADDNS